MRSRRTLAFSVTPQLTLLLSSVIPQSIATADMDHTQLEAFLTAQTRKQGSGGVNAEQAAALSRFWKSQRVRVRESLLAQSRWEPGLRGLSWRVDLQTAASRGDAAHSGPVTLLELELGRAGQVRRSFTCSCRGLTGRTSVFYSLQQLGDQCLAQGKTGGR